MQKKDKKNKPHEPVIGTPVDVKHEVHVGINVKTGKFEVNYLCIIRLSHTEALNPTP